MPSYNPDYNITVFYGISNLEIHTKIFISQNSIACIQASYHNYMHCICPIFTTPDWWLFSLFSITFHMENTKLKLNNFIWSNCKHKDRLIKFRHACFPGTSMSVDIIYETLLRLSVHLSIRLAAGDCAIVNRSCITQCIPALH